MSNKTILVNLSQANHTIQEFKHAFQLFNIGRVHVGKSQAAVQFMDIKDFQAFQFTNSHHQIVSLSGASYNVADSDFKWQYSPQHTTTIKDLKQFDRDDTQPDEEHQNKSADLQNGQHNQTNVPKSEDVKILNEEQRKSLLKVQNAQILNQKLKQQKQKLQQWRNSQNIDEKTSDNLKAYSSILQNYPFIKEKLQKVIVMANCGKDMFMRKTENIRGVLNDKAEEVCNYINAPENAKYKQVAMDNRYTLMLILFSIMFAIMFAVVF